jgi:dTDP-4-dehydrorhamnose 3,5-epimerase
MYDASEFYSQDCEGGLRYDDPRLQLSWPLPIARTSEKDRNWKLLEEIEPELRRRMGAMAVGTN